MASVNAVHTALPRPAQALTASRRPFSPPPGDVPAGPVAGPPRSGRLSAPPPVHDVARSAMLKARAALFSNPPVGMPDSGGGDSPLLGDVDGDGTVSAADSEALLAYLFGGGEAPVGLANADVNGDGEVDISDAIQLMSLIHGQPRPEGLPSRASNTARLNSAQNMARTFTRTG